LLRNTGEEELMESQPEEAVQSEDAKEMAAPPTSAEVNGCF